MLVGKNKKRTLLLGLLICLLAGGGFLYFKNEQAEAKKYIPEVGLPNGEEFLKLLQETQLYWSSKINLAALNPLPEKESDQKNVEIIKPVLHLENFEDGDVATELLEPPVTIATQNRKIPNPRIIEPPSFRKANDRLISTKDYKAKPAVPIELSQITQTYEPAPEQDEQDYLYEIEEEFLRVEGVLVPQKTTVISSSRDGKIDQIYVDNGDLFQAGDILLSYDCHELNSEIEAMRAAESLAKLKVEKGRELFKLDILSQLEREELKVEEKKAIAQNSILQAELESCLIRATYAGRVTNRLANPEEYTRTDRVLMEIASLGPLEVEFIVPSKWLRYMNIGAPITVTISETNEAYSAVVTQIYGEVDPVSQSIQMSARLTPYVDPLLPGMSGLIEVNAYSIREAGIRGYLETTRPPEIRKFKSFGYQQNSTRQFGLIGLSKKFISGVPRG